LPSYGILGAAVVWTIRALVDALALYVMALLLIPECRSAMGRFVLAIASANSLFLLTAQLDGLVLKGLFSSLLLLLFGLFVWRVVLQQSERNWLLRILHLRPVQ
jgi:hypothetical protein